MFITKLAGSSNELHREIANVLNFNVYLLHVAQFAGQAL